MVQSYGRLDTIGCFATVYIVSFPRGLLFLRVLVENVVSTIYMFCVNSSGFYDTRCRIYMLLTVVGIHLHLFNSSSLLVYFLCTLRSGGGGCDNPSGFTIAG